MSSTCDVGAPHRVIDLLDAFTGRLGHDNFLDHACGFADDRFLVGLGHLDGAFAKGVGVEIGDRAIDRAAPDVDLCLEQADLLVDRR